MVGVVRMGTKVVYLFISGLSLEALEQVAIICVYAAERALRSTSESIEAIRAYTDDNLSKRRVSPPISTIMRADLCRTLT